MTCRLFIPITIRGVTNYYYMALGQYTTLIALFVVRCNKIIIAGMKTGNANHLLTT